MDDDLSEYELRRLETIAQNAQAMQALGLADAVRSGAHKSMVFLWLEKHDLLTLKSYLNGKTRSFSLLGSAVAATGGIFFSLYLDADRTIFLCSIPCLLYTSAAADD